MKSGKSFFPVLFTVIMLFCVFFIVWYLPAVNDLNFQLWDVKESLKTSQGRERKQQNEYDETVSAIPEVQSEIDRLLPLNKALEDEVKALKEERNRLRDEKNELEMQLNYSDEQEDTVHE